MFIFLPCMWGLGFQNDSPRLLAEGVSKTLPNPKGPRRTKIIRVVNLPRVVFLVRRGDLLSRRTLCGHRFPGNYRRFSSQRRVHGVANVGGVVKTLRCSNSLFLLSAQYFSYGRVLWDFERTETKRTAHFSEVI